MKCDLHTRKMLFSLSVHYRLFAVTPGMEPVERSNTSVAGTSVAIEIVVQYFIIGAHAVGI